MSIAQKLTRIAQNQPELYAAGLAAGKALGGYDQGFQAGIRSEYDRFWDAYQYNGTRRVSQGMFAGPGWNSETLKPKYSIRPTLAPMMFYYCNTHSDNAAIDLADVFDKRGVTLDFSDCTDFQQMFYQAKIAKVGTIDCSKASGSNQVLNIFNTEYLRVVRCFIPPNVALPIAAFQSKLETFIIGGTITKSMNLGRCGKLTEKSIQSIIDNLEDLTGATTQILTFHADVGDKLTDLQKAAITAKNWTLAY